jgi:hypothetical protein
MAEKLSEATWTAFSKKQKLDLGDAPLVKALAKFDKTSEDKPEPRLEALQGLIEEIKKQVTAQARRKKEMGDKLFGEVKDKLYALLDSAEMLHKDTEKAVAARKASADDEEDSPALLTTKLIPLLREVRKGEVEMQALIALAGKETVVLLSRKAISPARGKLLKDQMTHPSGLKFIRGTCMLEQASVTFVVQAPAAGLAKKIKAALLQQTELRLKVRVRGEDPNDVDEEGEDNESTAEGSTIAHAPPLRTAGAAQPQAAAGAAQPQAAAGATDPAAAAFIARLTALVTKVKTAAPEVRAKVSEAGFIARKNHDFEGAHALLDEAERMLEGGPAVAARPAVAAGTAPVSAGDRSPATQIASVMKEALGKGIRRSRGPNAEAAKLHGQVQEATLNELPGLVPGFLKAAITSLPGDAAPLRQGDRPSPEDENLGIAADVNAWQRALVAWEQRIEVADGLRLELGRSEATLANKAPSEDEAKAHAALVAAYNSARLDAERAEQRALETRAGLEQAHQAARAH